MLRAKHPEFNQMEPGDMYHTTMDNALQNFKDLIHLTLTSNEAINIVTNAGNVVMLSESDYRDLLLTLEVELNPSFKQSLLDISSSKEDFLDESDVEW